MQEKSSSFERVIGTKDSEKKRELLDTAKEVFEKKKVREIHEHELPKTPEDVAVINLANEATNTLRRKFGSTEFDIPPENVLIVKEEHWDWGEGGKNACFYPAEQFVATPYYGQNFTFARKMFHEMLHFKSFGSLKILEGGQEMVEDRRGLRIRTRKGKEYFSSLNEAITEELTKQFIIDLIKKKNPLFRTEIEALEKKDIEPEAIEEQMVSGYGEQREILNLLVDKVFQRNREQFKDRQEVFDEFVKALFSSNLLSIGKLVDKTFGKGTFRKIGKLDRNSDIQLKFIQSL